jgi:CPA1 family monovalent cation:H+ antiporter
MLVGIGLSFLPLIHVPELSSELVLVGFLPPLLYAAAIRTSVIDFRANRRSIAQLSVLLVLVTALGVGLITWLILPVSFPEALALGAVVAPPDAGRRDLDRSSGRSAAPPGHHPRGRITG